MLFLGLTWLCELREGDPLPPEAERRGRAREQPTDAGTKQNRSAAVRTRRHSIIYGPPQEDRFGTVPCVSRGQAGDNAGGLVPDMSLSASYKPFILFFYSCVT